MRVEIKKLLTSRKFGFAVLMVLVIYVGTFSILSRENISIFGGASRNTTSYKNWSTRAARDKLTARINLQDTIITSDTMAKQTPKIPIPTTTNNNKSNSKSYASVTKPITNKYNTFTTIQPKTNNTNFTAKLTTITQKKNTTLSATRILSTPYQIVTMTIVRPSSTVRPIHFMCLRTTGRLGNLMFQYASTYGIARSKGMDLIISSKESLVTIFHLHLGSRILDDTSMCKGIRKKWEVRASAFDKETVHFDNDTNIELKEYLQSYKYFENVSDELRRQFKFRDSIQNKADQVIRNIFKKHLEKQINKNQTWTFVSIHVRRGDMVNHPHGYQVAPREYFNRTQNMFRSLYRNILFIVCSNDLKWCKDNLQAENTYFVEGNSAEVDMAIISSCNHTISSVGSYSWWAGWLSKGLVTYYYPPAREGSALRTQYSKDYSDYFLPTWIKVTL